ncbi:hypothetical protein KKC94_05600 [Patescibacteria group bacterium]|nr:hypothetical protein [Patescibacteria group bacterium]
MKKKTFFLQSEEPRNKVIIITVLLIICFSTTIFFQASGISEVYTHLYYLPITFSCIWWPEKGMIIPVLLGFTLILVHSIFQTDSSFINDFFRSLMFIGIGFAISTISRVEKNQKKLLNEKNLELQTSYQGLQIKNQSIEAKEARIEELKKEINFLKKSL